MSDEIAVALVGFMGVVLAAFIEYSRRSTRHKMEVVRYEVTENGGESAYDQLRRDISAVSGRIGHVAADVRGVRADIGSLHQTDRDIRADLRQAATDRSEEIRAEMRRHERAHHREDEP